MFIPLAGIESISQYNIVGYQVYDSGETRVLLLKTPVNVVRINHAEERRLCEPFDKSKSSRPISTSLTIIKSPSKMAKLFTDNELRNWFASVSHARADVNGPGVLGDELHKHPLFKEWMGRLKEQLQTVLKDRGNFGKEQAELVAQDELKELLTRFQTKYKKHGWDLNKVHEISELVFRDMLVEHVMEV
jgi:hypothetical protein